MNLGFHYHVIWRIDVFSEAKEISLTHKIKLFKFCHFTTLKLIIPCQNYSTSPMMLHHSNLFAYFLVVSFFFFSVTRIFLLHSGLSSNSLWWIWKRRTRSTRLSATTYYIGEAKWRKSCCSWWMWLRWVAELPLKQMLENSQSCGNV